MPFVLSCPGPLPRPSGDRLPSFSRNHLGRLHQRSSRPVLRPCQCATPGPAAMSLPSRTSSRTVIPALGLTSSPCRRWFSLSGLTTIPGVGAWIGSTASGATCGRQSAASVASLVRAPTRTWREMPSPNPASPRVATLIQEGALRRACAALLQDALVSPSGEVVSSLRALHPSPRADERANLGHFRRVSPRAAPIADIDQVRKAVHSFPSTSGAGRSGLRPSHLRDAMPPASSDLLLRLITEVVNLLLQGEVPETVRPFVCGASIMALRKPNGTLRPIAVGETLRRVTSKVAVELISERARTILEPLQLGVKASMVVRPLFTPPDSGFTGTGRTPPRRLSQWTSPTPSILSIAPLSCSQSARTSPLSFHGWTAAIAMIATSSRAPAMLVIRS